jgi:TolB-like protein/Tfp pilus assembly protein PilF
MFCNNRDGTGASGWDKLRQNDKPRVPLNPPFPAYSGSDPYIFVCYAHADAEAVYSYLVELRNAGVNIWFDEGISAGSVWRGDIAEAIEGAAQMLFFASPDSVASQHCNSELHYAFDRDIPVLPVYLAPTELSPDLRIGLSRVQAVNAESQAPEETTQILLDAYGRLNQKRSKPWYRNLKTWLIGIAAFVSVIGLTAYILLLAPEDHGQVIPEDIVEKVHAANSVLLENLPQSSIAVMPFDNLSPQEENAWVVDGMQVALIDALSRTRDFHVPGRRNMQALVAGNASLEDIGVALKVGMVVEGSITGQGDALRTTVRVFRVVDGQQIWSGRYDRSKEDLFSVQEEVAIEVAEAIRHELGLQPLSSGLRLTRYETSDLRAYELFTRAQQITRGVDDFLEPKKRQESESLVDEALAVDKNYPAALAFKGFLMMWRGDLAGARTYAERALEAGPYASAHGLLGEIAIRERRWDDAVAQYETALELEPWNGNLHSTYSQLLLSVFQFEKARYHARLATEFDPQHPFTRFSRAAADMHTGHYESAAEQYYQTMDMGDDGPLAKLHLARSLYMMNRESEAAKLYLAAFSQMPYFRGVLIANPGYRTQLEQGQLKLMLQDFLAGLGCKDGGAANIALQWYGAWQDDAGFMKCLNEIESLEHLRLYDHRLKAHWYAPEFVALLEKLGQDKYLPDQNRLVQ